MTMGAKMQGRPFIAFEPGVEVGKYRSEILENLHTLFEAIIPIIPGNTRV
jgi:hypothetical protein